MPHHVDGITVSIKTPNGSTHNEYTNPHEKRHEECDGPFASRIVVARPGDQFELQVTFGNNFNLHNAGGVMVNLEIGDQSRFVNAKSHGQTFWVDAEYIKNNRTLTLKKLAIWEDRKSAYPTQYETLEVPLVDPEYAKATAEWQVDPEEYTANSGCIAVCVARGYLRSHKTAPYHVTEPPLEWMSVDSGMPKIIDGLWVDYHEEEGHMYLYEFRIMGADAITPGQRVARPVFGYGDSLERVKKAFGADAVASDDENDADFNLINGNCGKRKAVDFMASPKKRRITGATEENTSQRDEGRISKTSIGIGCQGFTGCCDEDDEEILPAPTQREVKEEAEIKQEQHSESEQRRTQTVTPPPETVPGQPGVAGNLDNSASQVLVDLTIEDIKEQSESHTARTQPVATNVSSLTESDEEHFDLQVRQAEIERDFQLKLAKIENERKAFLRKKQAGIPAA